MLGRGKSYDQLSRAWTLLLALPFFSPVTELKSPLASIFSSVKWVQSHPPWLPWEAFGNAGKHLLTVLWFGLPGRIEEAIQALSCASVEVALLPSGLPEGSRSPVCPRVEAGGAGLCF